MSYKFYTKLNKVVREALNAINTYNGKKATTLPTGEKAIDNDDAWLIIGGEEPILRDKREQRLREKGKFNEEDSTDVYISDSWSYEDICVYADKLVG